MFFTWRGHFNVELEAESLSVYLRELRCTALWWRLWDEITAPPGLVKGIDRLGLDDVRLERASEIHRQCLEFDDNDLPKNSSTVASKVRDYLRSSIAPNEVPDHSGDNWTFYPPE